MVSMLVYLLMVPFHFPPLRMAHRRNEMCTNLNEKSTVPVRLILQVLKAAGMIYTNRNGIEWTDLYMHKYGGAVGPEKISFWR